MLVEGATEVDETMGGVVGSVAKESVVDAVGRELEGFLEEDMGVAVVGALGAMVGGFVGTVVFCRTESVGVCSSVGVAR